MFKIQIFFTIIAISISSCSQSGINKKDIIKSDFNYKLARNDYDNGKVQEAIRELHISINLNPQNHEAHYLLGFIYLGRNMFDEALKEFKTTIQIKPDFLEAVNNLGATLIAIERYEEAINVLKPLSENPFYPTPHLVLGNIGWSYYKIKDYTRALIYLEKSTFINPKFCLGYNNSGLTYLAIGNLEKAITNFEKAIKYCPNYAEPYFRIGSIYARMGKDEMALEVFRKCSEIAKDSVIGQRCKSKL